MFVTGAGIQWLRDGLQIIDQASGTEAMAACRARGAGQNHSATSPR
ncbi:MAG: hypothetical protein QOF26_3376 [Baekduia sp.]|jgi:glycerol kinase|nr:hypothetical protein [Baekduia sp.]